MSQKPVKQFSFAWERGALAAYEQGKGDFADYLIREEARAAGCQGVATFDKQLLREPMFVAP